MCLRWLNPPDYAAAPMRQESGPYGVWKHRGMKFHVLPESQRPSGGAASCQSLLKNIRMLKSLANTIFRVNYGMGLYLVVVVTIYVSMPQC